MSGVRTRASFGWLSWPETDGRSPQILTGNWPDPVLPNRELASVLMQWHVPGGRLRPTAIQRTMNAYVNADGPASINGLSSFRAYAAAAINNPHIQAYVAVAADALPEHGNWTMSRLTSRSGRYRPERSWKR